MEHQHVSHVYEQGWTFCDPGQLRNTSNESTDVDGHEYSVERKHVVKVHLVAQIWFLGSVIFNKFFKMIKIVITYAEKQKIVSFNM